MFDTIKVTTTIEINNIKLQINDPTVTTSVYKLLDVLKEYKTDLDIVSSALSDGRIKYDVSGINNKIYENVKNMMSLFPQLSGSPLEDIFQPMRLLIQGNTQSEDTLSLHTEEMNSVKNMFNVSNELDIENKEIQDDDQRSIRITPFD